MFKLILSLTKAFKRPRRDKIVGGVEIALDLLDLLDNESVVLNAFKKELSAHFIDLNKLYNELSRD